MQIHTDPVSDRSAWTPGDLARDSSWESSLSTSDRAELASALERVEARGLLLAEITRSDFPLPGLAGTLAPVLEQLRTGRGFAVLHGLPTEGYELDQLEKMYWGVSAHLGIGVTQNSDASLIHYVTDGKLRPQQGTRGVGDPGPVELHVDLSDCVGLFCVRQAPDDPASVVASSMTVYNAILQQHPEWLPRLYEGFIWDRAAEEGHGESPVSGYPVPAFSAAQRTVTCRFHPTWIRKGLARVEEALTDDEEEIFAFIRDTADANSFSFPLHSGDAAICNNYTVFHGRAAHEPVPDEARKRVLMRIWLELPDVRPFADEARTRYGVIRHGKLGWTAAQVAAGALDTLHRRRADGVPVL
jgi:hypothetical protein